MIEQLPYLKVTRDPDAPLYKQDLSPRNKDLRFWLPPGFESGLRVQRTVYVHPEYETKLDMIGDEYVPGALRLRSDSIVPRALKKALQARESDSYLTANEIQAELAEDESFESENLQLVFVASAVSYDNHHPYNLLGLFGVTKFPGMHIETPIDVEPIEEQSGPPVPGLITRLSGPTY